MEHLNQEEQKETIYFLEWLSKESGFTKNQILENMRPENQRWDDLKPYKTIEEYHETRKNKDNEYLYKLFHWKFSILNDDHYFWDDINAKWLKLVKSNKYNIDFCNSLIINWKIIDTAKNIKTKKIKI